MSDQQSTVLDFWLRQARHDVKFYSEKIEGQIGWLEGHVRDLRRQIDQGSIHEQRNLVATAGDIADYSGKLRSALDRVMALEALQAEGIES